MLELTFIDVQSEPQQNLVQIKRHAALVKHRNSHRASASCRYEAKQPLRRQCPPSATSARRCLDDDEHEFSQDATIREISRQDISHVDESRYRDRNANQKPHRKSTTKQKMKSFQVRWRISQPSRTATALQQPTAIIPPDDTHTIELALSQASTWLISQFSSTWGARLTHNTTTYDLDNGVEIVRESFFVVSDLLSTANTPQAFSALNHLLNTIPHFLRNPHPELFFCLMELSAGINMMRTPALHTKVKKHVAELSAMILGVNHPITVMLKCNFGQGRHFYATELVFACIVDTLSRTFGPGSYQTLCHQFGRSQFYAGTGRVDLGQHLIADVADKWSTMYGSDSALAKLAEYELRKMQVQALKMQNMDGEYKSAAAEVMACNAMLGVESTIGVVDGSKFYPNVVEVPLHRSGGSVRLARHLLETKRYTLALHVYAHAEDSESNDDERHLPRPNRALADHITRSVGAAIEYEESHLG